MLALLLTRRGLWCGSDRNRVGADSYGNRVDDRVALDIDDRDRVRNFIRRVGSNSIWRDGHTNWTHPDRNRRKHAVGLSVDDRDGVVALIRHELIDDVRPGSVWCDGYSCRKLVGRNRRDNGVGLGVNNRNRVDQVCYVGSSSIWRNSYARREHPNG